MQTLALIETGSYGDSQNGYTSFIASPTLLFPANPSSPTPSVSFSASSGERQSDSLSTGSMTASPTHSPDISHGMHHQPSWTDSKTPSMPSFATFESEPHAPDSLYTDLPTYRFPAQASQISKENPQQEYRFGTATINSQLYAHHVEALNGLKGQMAKPVAMADVLSHDRYAQSFPPSVSPTTTFKVVPNAHRLGTPQKTFPTFFLSESAANHQQHAFDSAMIGGQPYPSGLVGADPHPQQGRHAFITNETPVLVNENRNIYTSPDPSRLSATPQTPRNDGTFVPIQYTPQGVHQSSAQHLYSGLSVSPSATSPSTFTPAAHYSPAKTHLTPPPITHPARSAPTTPLGRQDAKFINSTRAWTTPQPLQPALFNVNSNSLQTHQLASPHISADDAPNLNGPPPVYYSADEQEYDSRMDFDQTSNNLYIPYARTPRVFKRTSSISPHSHPAKLKTPFGVIDKSPRLVSPALSAESDSKTKVTRCKIACSCCRKTRLKCDGQRPCSSCIEKFMKRNPVAKEASAAAAILQAGTCQYDADVRRRGKGKKTLEKEREERMLRMQRR